MHSIVLQTRQVRNTRTDLLGSSHDHLAGRLRAGQDDPVCQLLASEAQMRKKTRKADKVEKIIQPHPVAGEPERAQIGIDAAEHLYREIRIENSLKDDRGRNVKPKKGEKVYVIIEADAKATSPHESDKRS